MTIYSRDGDEFIPIGVVNPQSIFDQSGPSYVHVFEEFRKQFGLSDEPFDYFFDTYDNALDWINDMLIEGYIGF